MNNHDQLYIHICMQKHNDAIIKTSGHSSLKKYTSHFIERVVCERELETEQNSNILTPTRMAITARLSCSPGQLNRGPGGPVFLGQGSHSSIFSPTDLYSNCSIGVLRGPSAGCWFSLQLLISNWFEPPVHRVILLFYAHSIQTVDSQGYPLTSSTGCTCYLHKCISYFDSLAGSEFNIQQYHLI